MEKRRTPDTATDRLLTRYYSILDRLDTAVTREEQEPVFDALDAFWARLTPEEEAAVIRNTGLKDHPLAKELRQDNRELRTYWEIANEAWRHVQNEEPRLREFETAADFRRWLEQEIVGRGLTGQRTPEQHAVIRRYNGLVRLARERYRHLYPNIETLLLKWDRVSRASTAQAAAGAQEELVDAS